MKNTCSNLTNTTPSSHFNKQPTVKQQTQVSQVKWVMEHIQIINILDNCINP
ncbi:hypothetical protein B7P43_G01498 [Cryptotermes secundus]|uniref:Uncharacterized protein n=1 Tax=Cryptotermes secundus TaxID=105785 RepID=A0A2J7RK15_9NEOP|nr:hypothetical protein B7P43_G01498 [Cryptotermes secundus]